MAKRITEESRLKQCKICSNKFRCRTRIEIKKRLFCSLKCRTVLLRKKLSKDRKGKGNPMYGKVGWSKGMKMSKEHCKKLSEAHKGLPGYWKGKKRPPMSKEAREKIRQAMLGRKITWNDKLKVPKSEEHKRNMSLAKRGSKHPNWKGGVYIDYSKSPRYKRWRKKVVDRDNYTCQKCGSKKQPQAHHLKNKKDYPELMFNVDNGQTLCYKCHKKTDTFGSKQWKLKSKCLK